MEGKLRSPMQTKNYFSATFAVCSLSVDTSFQHPSTTTTTQFTQAEGMNLHTLVLLASITLLQIHKTAAFASTINMSERKRKRPRRENDTTSNIEKDERLSYLEFYSGIGGWTMAFEEALGLPPSMKPKRLAALDHSDLCMRVFEHNFGREDKKYQIQIERLTKKQVETWSAKYWFMSPPCRKF